MESHKNRVKRMTACLLLCGLLLLRPGVPVFADAVGVLRYTNSDTVFTIMGCDENATDAELKSAFAVLEASVLGGGCTFVIGENAFQNCSQLTRIELPSCVTEIRANAFADADALQAVYVPPGPVDVQANAFADRNPALVVWGEDGSEIEGYCKQNAVPFFCAVGRSSLDPLELSGQDAAFTLKLHNFSGSALSVLPDRPLLLAVRSVFVGTEGCFTITLKGEYSGSAHLIIGAGEVSVRLPVNVETGKKLPGDVTGDYRIDLFDLIAVRDHIFGKILLTGDHALAADANKDGKVNVFDVMALRDWILGKK